jgi:phosphoglycolate phosphatase
MEYLKSDENNTVYIGDSEVDVETARNCNIPCIAVSWGFRDREELQTAGADYMINHPKELLDLVLR